MEKNNHPANISEIHFARKAIVYVRQSSQKQVKNNEESKRLQYALADKARAWGWNDIEIIDEDLGSSAAQGATVRIGFERTTSLVALGQVGIILSREVSRLSRTDKDWCRLLEVCGVFHTLLSDGDQVYNPTQIDDQLILGIKGILSVNELSVLRLRMVAGMEEKARRGEFQRPVPPGYVWDITGNVVKDPDQRVQEIIPVVFKKFRELQTVRQVFLWFHHEGIELPVTHYQGGYRGITWQLPKSSSFIKSILQNPFYAGVYEWGKNQTKLAYINGRVVKTRSRGQSPEKAKVFIENHHEAYIDMASFDEVQQMIKSNVLKQCKGEHTGATRDGQGLLAGMLRCGRCGRKFYVTYHGKQGTAARYICRGSYESGGDYCIAFGGSTVDKQISAILLEAISPYGIEASLKAAQMEASKHQDKCAVLAKKVSALEYEAKRAFEQYNEVDPRNRLVAFELEKRWNEKLQQCEVAQKKLAETEQQQMTLTAEEQLKLASLGDQFSTLWSSGACPNSFKKKIIRTVVNEVIVNLDEDEKKLRFIIHWQGGCHTSFEMDKPPAGVGQKTQDEDLEIIRKMSNRYGDADIARVLNKNGRKTATGKRWNKSRVQAIRGKYSIAGHTCAVKDPNVLTLAGAAEYLEVSSTTIKRLVAEDVVMNYQGIPWAPWEIKRGDLDAGSIRAIIQSLKKTGKLVLEKDDSIAQKNLFSQ